MSEQTNGDKNNISTPEKKSRRLPLAGKALIVEASSELGVLAAMELSHIGGTLALFLWLAALLYVVAAPIIDIFPTAENISSGNYPFTVEFYAVTRGAPTGNVKTLIDYILSDAGQKIIENTGYARFTA